MGIRSMIQFTGRVAAFAVVTALLLQISCTIGLPANLQLEGQGDTGCHESAPPTPNTPDSSHVCCSGDHSPEALLSAFVTHAPMVSDPGMLDLTLALRFFASPSAGFLASFSPPHQALTLRI
jgi:hypothetical protein